MSSKKKFGATKKLFEKTNLRVEKVEEAIQEHVKKTQQMEEDLAKMNAGGTAERITRRRKTMENDSGEKGQGAAVAIFHYFEWTGGLGLKRWKL